MPAEDDGYRQYSFNRLLTAVEYGDATALTALKEFLRLLSGKQSVVLERHPQHGWRARGLIAPDSDGRPASALGGITGAPP
jgi:hypothetical protein